MVAAAIRTIFAQPTGPMVRAQVETVVLILQPQLPAAATMLRDAKGEITAFADFPRSPLAQGVVHEPVGYLARLNKRSRAEPAGWGSCPTRLTGTPGHRRAHRDPRRVAGRRTPLPLRGIHGPAQPSSPDRDQHDHDQQQTGVVDTDTILTT